MANSRRDSQFEAEDRTALVAGPRLESNGAPILPNIEVVRPGKSSHKEKVVFAGNIPELKRQPRPPELQAVRFPQWNGGGSPVTHVFLVHDAAPVGKVAKQMFPARRTGLRKFLI